MLKLWNVCFSCLSELLLIGYSGLQLWKHQLFYWIPVLSCVDLNMKDWLIYVTYFEEGYIYLTISYYTVYVNNQIFTLIEKYFHL